MAHHWIAAALSFDAKVAFHNGNNKRLLTNQGVLSTEMAGGFEKETESV